MRSGRWRLFRENFRYGLSVSAFMLAWRTADLPVVGLFNVPNSVKAITPLIGQILVESEKLNSQEEAAELYLFYNRPKHGAMYEPVSQRLLPLDEIWLQRTG